MGLLNWMSKGTRGQGTRLSQSQQARIPTFEQLEPRVLLDAGALVPVGSLLMETSFEAAIVVDLKTDQAVSSQQSAISDVEEPEGGVEDRKVGNEEERNFQTEGTNNQQPLTNNQTGQSDSLPLGGETGGPANGQAVIPSTDVNGCNQTTNYELQIMNNQELTANSQLLHIPMGLSASNFAPQTSDLDASQIRGPPANNLVISPREIIFIDSSINNDIQLENAALNGAAISVFHPDQDGLRHITNVLYSYRNLSAIHIISHGAPGQVSLGTSVLNAKTLESNTASLASWDTALTDQADILLYGCSVGQGVQGHALIDRISNLTGADVAASINPTGHIDFGGDWNLEYSTGLIEAGFGSSVNAYPIILEEPVVEEWAISFDGQIRNDFHGVSDMNYPLEGSLIVMVGANGQIVEVDSAEPFLTPYLPGGQGTWGAGIGTIGFNFGDTDQQYTFQGSSGTINASGAWTFSGWAPREEDIETFLGGGSWSGQRVVEYYPPVAAFTYEQAGIQIDFDASSSFDPGGSEIIDYQWDFGDGTGITSTSDPVITHDYAFPGEYVVELTVWDEGGVSGTASLPVSRSITVLATGAIHGNKWHDLNGDGIWDADEPGLAGWTIYLDEDGDSELDSGEISTVTAIDGSYGFGDLVPGTYTVAEVLQTGWMQTYPATLSQEVSLNADQVVSNINFGNRQIGSEYVVDSLLDTIAVDGQLTLREALEAANGNAPIGDAVAGSSAYVDVIRFDSSLAGGTIVIGSELIISDDIIIEWLEAEPLSIDADNNDRVLMVNPNVEASVTGLRLTGGSLGGVYNTGTLTLTNTTVSGNYSTSSGGGIYNSITGTLTLTNTIVSGNSSGHLGGGIMNSRGVLVLTNTTVSGNVAGSAGGGIYNSGGTLTMTNTTVSGNSSSSGGGVSTFGTMLMYNTVVALNESTGTEPDVSGGIDSSSSHNFVGNASGLYGISDGENGNIVGGGDPGLFVMKSTGGSILYYPTTGTPLIDAGDSSLIAASTDILGNPRVQGDSVDIGAIEGVYTLPTSLALVSPAEGAILQASQSDLVEVAVSAPASATVSVFLDDDGIIDGDEKFICQDTTVGRVGTLRWKSAWSPAGSYWLTVIVDDGSFSAPMTDQVEFTIAHQEQVVYIVDSLADTVDPGDGQLTLREALEAANTNSAIGNAVAGSAGEVDVIRFDTALAEGTIVLGSQLSIRDDVIVEWLEPAALMIDANDASGVLAVYAGVDAAMTGLTLTGGSAQFGAGVYNSGILSLTDITVSGNSSRHRGGGIYNSSGIVTLTNSIVSGNSAGSSGGGIHMDYGTLTLTNSTVSGNSARMWGGGIYNQSDCVVTLTNTTVAGNSSVSSGGGIYNNYGSVTMHNTVVVLNESQGTQPDVYGSLESSSSHNFIGNASGMSGISDGENGNIVGGGDTGLLMRSSGGSILYYPISGSPLVDTGDNSLVSGSTDILGNPRIQDGLVDMGAIEGVYTLPTYLALVSPVEGAVLEASQSDLIEIDVSAPASATVTVFLDNDGIINGDEEFICQDAPIWRASRLHWKSAWSPAGTYVLTVIADDESFTAPMTDQTQLTIVHQEQVVYVVTSLTDVIQMDGELTLREAVEAANANAAVGDAVAGSSEEVDIIRFDASLAGDVIVLSSQLTISDDIIIEWIEAEALAIDANNTSGLLSIGYGVDADVSGLRLTGGSSTFGGGVYNEGTLTLTNTLVSGNSSIYGGGVYNNYGTLALINTTVSGNSASSPGGGIFNYGTLTLTDSTVSGNSSMYGGGIYTMEGVVTLTNTTISGNSATSDYSYGGGIFISDATVTLIDTTVSNNSAGWAGGGIFSYGDRLTLTNSTVSGNSSGGYGGGIENRGTLTLTNTTILDNSSGSSGGGIYNSGTVTMHNTIVSENTSAGTMPDIGGAVVGSHNLIGDGTGMTGLNHGVGGNLVGTSQGPIPSMLTPLQDNGGSTWTHALLVGSPAIDAGDNAHALDAEGNALDWDQRGFGFVRRFDASVDIGAFEWSEFDYGDAPAPYAVTTSENGPSHAATGPILGANRDGESDGGHSENASADDVAGLDDEDGLNNPMVDLMLTEGTNPRINVIVTNTSGSAATLYGWIDYNADGVFDNAEERASVVVPDGTNNVIVTLVFPTVPTGTAGSTYARFRISTDAAAASPTGMASDGEVEDYPVSITRVGSGLVEGYQKISDTEGGFTGILGVDQFGNSVVSMGDLDGDGITDLAVGAYADATGGGNNGAVWILFLNSNGTVKGYQKIAENTGGFTGSLDGDLFGNALTNLGDLDGNGVPDLAVGSSPDDDGGPNRGAVWILFLNGNGTVKAHQKISDTEGNFTGILDDDDYFGTSVASLGPKQAYHK